jgi:transcriptional regulator with XRE-family HTH domain
MQTLKQIRAGLLLNQSDIASKLNLSVPSFSLLENGQTVPSIEDMIYLEKEFGQRIDWSPNEKIDIKAKQNILSTINALSRHYPMISVLNFSQKYIRDDRSGSPDKIFLWYEKVAHLNDIKPLIAPNPDIKRTK